METALSTISILPSTREQFTTFKRMLKNEILQNDRDQLPLLVNLTIAKKSIEDVLSDNEIEYHFVKEFELHKEKVLEISGAKLNEQETGVKYNYSDCGDPVWNDLTKQIDELTKKRKEREKFLQSIPFDAGVVDADTGLFLTRPPKSSTTKIIVKLF